MASFLGFLEATGKDIVHVVEEAPKIVTSIGKLLADGVSLAPAVKDQIENIMQAGEAVVLAGGGAAASEGKNIALDVATVSAVQTFIKVFLVAYPVLMRAAGQGIDDIKAAVEAATAPAA